MRRAKRRAAFLGLDARFHLLDGAGLRFKDERFDCVLLHFLLAVAPGPGACVREAGSVLGRGRILCVLDSLLDEGVQAPFWRRCLDLSAYAMAIISIAGWNLS